LKHQCWNFHCKREYKPIQARGYEQSFLCADCFSRKAAGEELFLVDRNATNKEDASLATKKQKSILGDELRHYKRHRQQHFTHPSEYKLASENLGIRNRLAGYLREFQWNEYSLDNYRDLSDEEKGRANKQEDRQQRDAMNYLAPQLCKFELRNIPDLDRGVIPPITVHGRRVKGQDSSKLLERIGNSWVLNWGTMPYQSLLPLEQEIYLKELSEALSDKRTKERRSLGKYGSMSQKGRNKFKGKTEAEIQEYFGNKKKKK
jgi:hypothetical protein